MKKEITLLNPKTGKKEKIVVDIQPDPDFKIPRFLKLSDKELRLKAISLDTRYFSEMEFEKFKNKLGKYEFLDPNSKKWKTDFLDPLGDTPIISEVSEWVIAYFKRAPHGLLGQCNCKKKEIRITKGLSKREEKFVLLHELIHYYDNFFLKFLPLRDYILLYYYDYLYKRFGNKKLWRFINSDQHFLTRVHTPFFLFKSLQLDIKLKLPFGTIYGYGREDMLK